MDLRELMKLEVDPVEVQAIYELWKQHSIAEDNRDIPGLCHANRRLRLRDRRDAGALGGPRRRNALLHRPPDRLPGHPLRPHRYRRRPPGRRRGGGGHRDARARLAGLGAERRARRVPVVIFFPGTGSGASSAARRSTCMWMAL